MGPVPGMIRPRAGRFRMEAGASRLGAPFSGVRVPPSDTVRFGMIGVGMQGSGLLGAAIALPGVTCTGAADLYDGRHMLANEIAGPNLPATREYRRLLDDKTIPLAPAHGGRSGERRQGH